MALYANRQEETSEDLSKISQLKASDSTLLKQQSSHSSKKVRYETQTSHDLTFFLQQQKEGAQRTLITPQIRFVMFQFLITTVKPFTQEFLTKNVLELIFKRAVFKESRRADTKSPSEYLYTYGKGCNYFVLIISGEATIEVGKEKLEFPSGPFAYFGVNALLCGSETVEQLLQDETASMSSDTESKEDFTAKKKPFSKQYIPDFSLRVDDRCVYMKVDRDLWRSGVIKSRYELLNNQKSDSIDYLPNGQKSDSDLSNMGVSVKLNGNASPKVSFLKRLPGESASPVLNGPNSKLNSRRSTFDATALAKLQEASNQSKRNNIANKSNQLQQLKELSDSQEVVAQQEMDSLIISEEIINETEPFLTKKYSTSSQTIDNQKSKNSEDKYSTLSQKSYDD